MRHGNCIYNDHTVNDAIANMDEATTNEDTPVTIPILSNDTDVDGGIDPSSVTMSHRNTAV